MAHQINIIIHVVAGTIALLLGALAIGLNANVRIHKKLGIIFLWFLAIVVGSGFIGWMLFRSDPFLLMLTIISGYQGFAGVRIIRMKDARPQVSDAVVAGCALMVALLYVFVLSSTKAGMSSPVVTSTLIALAIVTCYDLAKYFFTHAFVKKWWLYEHIYKMISAFSAILSAFIGTVVHAYQPYSQLGPSVICVWLIGYFIWRRARLPSHHHLH